MFTNRVCQQLATSFTAAKSSLLKSMLLKLLSIREGVELFGSTTYPLFRPEAIETCANVLPPTSAMRFSVGFVFTFSPVVETWFCEPSGE